jgi:hypothetical protein
MHMPNPAHTVGNVQPPPAAAAPGNQRATKHAAYSDSLINPRAQAIAADVLAANPHLDVQRNGAAVARYAVACARCARIYEWLAEQPDDTFTDVDAGITHRVLDRLTKWESQCEAAERALTIAPLTRAKLKLTQAQALDAATALSAAREEPDADLRRAILERAGLIDGRGVGIADSGDEGARSPDLSRNENLEPGERPSDG